MSQRERAEAILAMLRSRGCFPALYPSDIPDLLDCIQEALDATEDLA